MERFIIFSIFSLIFCFGCKNQDNKESNYYKKNAELIYESNSILQERIATDHGAGAYYIYNREGDSTISEINRGYEDIYKLARSETLRINELGLTEAQSSFNKFLVKSEKIGGCSSEFEVGDLIEDVIDDTSLSDEEIRFRKEVIKLKILLTFNRKISCLFNNVH